MAFTLFVLAGAAYGAGNFFGAEIRAKANSWAMSCITGGIIALLIILFSDILITNLMPGYTKPSCP
jgi:Na+-driven multidrug efflux pump